MRATHEYQKHGISPRIQVRSLEILSFDTISDLRRSDDQNWSDQKTKLIHASQATRGYQNHGVSSNSTR